jgi:hypothetical protein
MLAKIHKDPFTSVLGFVIIAIVTVSYCVICSLVYFFAAPNIVVHANESLVHYPNAQPIYQINDVAGGSDWQDAYIIYWTPDNKVDVQRYLEHSWGILNQTTSDGFVMLCNTKIASVLALYDLSFSLCIADANQSSRREFVSIRSGNQDWYEAIDQVPQSGTLIAFRHDFFAG